jgi:hypothetical protein
MFKRLLGWWFAPALWIDGLRHSEWNTEPIRQFRSAVWKQAESDGVDTNRYDAQAFLRYANRMKWQREWRGMYLRSQGLVIAGYAVLALELAPVVAAPLALIWWLAQHVTIGWR